MITITITEDDGVPSSLLARDQPEAFDKISKYFTNKLEKEREKMGIDNEVFKALKTLRTFLRKEET